MDVSKGIEGFSVDISWMTQMFDGLCWCDLTLDTELRF